MIISYEFERDYHYPYSNMCAQEERFCWSI